MQAVDINPQQLKAQLAELQKQLNQTRARHTRHALELAIIAIKGKLPPEDDQSPSKTNKTPQKANKRHSKKKRENKQNKPCKAYAELNGILIKQEDSSYALKMIQEGTEDTKQLIMPVFFLKSLPWHLEANQETLLDGQVRNWKCYPRIYKGKLHRLFLIGYDNQVSPERWEIIGYIRNKDEGANHIKIRSKKMSKVIKLELGNMSPKREGLINGQYSEVTVEREGIKVACKDIRPIQG